MCLEQDTYHFDMLDKRKRHGVLVDIRGSYLRMNWVFGHSYSEKGIQGLQPRREILHVPNPECSKQNEITEEIRRTKMQKK